MPDSIVISLTAICDNPDITLKASEVMQRAAVGLVLEGISVAINFTNVPETDDNEHSDNENRI